jgi:aryl-alcohol dehydrogenase-like predicted oxidoreductase
MSDQAHITLARGILGKTTTALGFGCGALFGRSRLDASLRVLEAALDSGITYFDVARMYGEGEAEAVVGQALRGRRHQVVLTSKAGILPTRRSLAKRAADRAAVVLRKAPGLGSIIPPPRPAAPRFGAFAPSQLRASVETSLKALGTDYLDSLLLHECAADDAADPEVRAFAEDLQRQGKIRAFGIATGLDETLAILATGRGFGSVVQIASSVWDEDVRKLPRRDDGVVVTHSCLGPRFREVVGRLREDRAAAERWRALVGVDPLDAQAVAQAFLAHAIRANPSGVVLFASSNPARVRANLLAAEAALFNDAQLDNLAIAVKSL